MKRETEEDTKSQCEQKIPPLPRIDKKSRIAILTNEILSKVHSSDLTRGSTNKVVSDQELNPASKIKKKILAAITHSLTPEMNKKIGADLSQYRDEVLHVIEKWAKVQKENRRNKETKEQYNILKKKNTLSLELVSTLNRRNKVLNDTIENQIGLGDIKKIKQKNSSVHKKSPTVIGEGEEKPKQIESIKNCNDTPQDIQLQQINRKSKLQNEILLTEKEPPKFQINNINSNTYMPHVKNNLSKDNKRSLSSQKQYSTTKKPSLRLGVQGINCTIVEDRRQVFRNELNEKRPRYNNIVINFNIQSSDLDQFSSSKRAGRKLMGYNDYIRDKFNQPDTHSKGKYQDPYSENSNNNIKEDRIKESPKKRRCIDENLNSSESADQKEKSSSSQPRKINFFQELKLKPKLQMSIGQKVTKKETKPSIKFLSVLKEAGQGNKEALRDLFLDMVDKINLSNNIVISKSRQVSYTAYIGRGNNSSLVKDILKKRWWWKIVDSADEACFVWTQKLKNGFLEDQETGRMNTGFSRLLFNEIKEENYLNELSDGNIDGLTTEKIKMLETQEGKEFFELNCLLFEKDIIPHILGTNIAGNELFSMGFVENEKLPQVKLQALDSKEEMIVPAIIIQHFQPSINHTSIPQSEIYLHNHIEETNLLGDKKDLFLNLTTFLRKQNQDPFSILPITILTHPRESLSEFRSIFIQRENQGLPNVWILKPAINSNRGKGIEVKKNLQDISRYVCESHVPVIIQLYITEPFLYHSRKFDLRMFMLVTWVEGSIKAYFFDEGYVRTATNTFSLDDLEDNFIHLTNEAIQINCDSFSKFEKGNKLTIEALEEYIKSTFKKDYSFLEDTFPTMKVVVANAESSL